MPSPIYLYISVAFNLNNITLNHLIKKFKIEKMCLCFFSAEIRQLYLVKNLKNYIRG